MLQSLVRLISGIAFAVGANLGAPTTVDAEDRYRGHSTETLTSDSDPMPNPADESSPAIDALSSPENPPFSVDPEPTPAETPELDLKPLQADDLKEKDDKKDEKDSKPEPKKWYEKLSIRGYGQIRINEVTHLDQGSAPAQYVGDRSIGDDQDVLIRRARVIIFGDVHERLGVYLQPDFASSVSGSVDNTFYAQLRDWYADVYLDDDKEFRFRVGQSKVPYGWENMQSSQNRLPLDRNDAFNSGTRNERDLGAFFYWTPKDAQQFFKDATEKGLKGSGNYGVFAFGAYNGQGGSLQEQNDNLHVVSRLTIPYTFDNGQMMEAAIQGYIGEYVVLSSPIEPLGVGPAVRPAGTLETGDHNGWNDKRLGATFVWYPQPLGFQTEWTVGRGPTLNEEQTAIENRSLYGGYAMVNYKLDDCCGTMLPFVRYQFYRGGYKSERNAPYVEVDEWEMGMEWQIHPAAELTLSYLITDRTNTTAMSDGLSYRQFMGDVARLQFQFNF